MPVTGQIEICTRTFTSDIDRPCVW